MPTTEQVRRNAIPACDHRNAGPLVKRLLDYAQLLGRAPATTTAPSVLISISEISTCSGICLSLNDYAELPGRNGGQFSQGVSTFHIASQLPSSRSHAAHDRRAYRQVDASIDTNSLLQSRNGLLHYRGRLNFFKAVLYAL